MRKGLSRWGGLTGGGPHRQGGRQGGLTGRGGPHRWGDLTGGGGHRCSQQVGPGSEWQEAEVSGNGGGSLRSLRAGSSGPCVRSRLPPGASLGLPACHAVTAVSHQPAPAAGKAGPVPCACCAHCPLRASPRAGLRGPAAHDQNVYQTFRSSPGGCRGGPSLRAPISWWAPTWLLSPGGARLSSICLSTALPGQVANDQRPQELRVA